MCLAVLGPLFGLTAATSTTTLASGVVIGSSTLPTLSTSALLAGASLGLTAIGTGISTAGAIKQGKYQSDIMKRNAELARMQAKDAQARGREAETRHRMAVLQRAGQATTAMAASGVSLAGGTPASLLEEIHYMGELDAMTIRHNAEREAWGYEAQAGGYEAQGGLYRQAGTYGATSSLLTGAGTMAHQWYQYRQPYQSYRY